MRIGIRTKLVTLLLLVAVLPLLAGLATIMIGGRQLRIEAFGQTVQAMAESKASALADSLAKDIEKFRLAFQRHEGLLGALSAAAQEPSEIQRERIRTLDRRWAGLHPSSPEIVAVLETPVADSLRALQVEDERLAEVLVADRWGRLVAATQRTSDYYQADELWWAQAFGDGQRGKVYVPNVGYDESSRTWSLDVCVPLRRAEGVAGVAKAVLDISRWVGPPRAKVGHIDAALALLRSDGMILFGGQAEPLSRSMAHWQGRIASLAPGWRVTDDGRIQGFAPVRLPVKVGPDILTGPRWMVVFSVSRAQAVGAVNRLSLVVLAIGLLIIASLFLLGLIVVDRRIARRIRTLARATHRVAEGDLTHRVESVRRGRPLLGHDEIDALVDDFNRMVHRVQRSHGQLVTANKLKTDFIRVASHELRTPISFILGTVKLLRESTDVARLQHAMQAMGAKANRLDRIINDMFKLIPSGNYDDRLHYRGVSSAELLEQVREDCLPFIEQRNQRLIVEEARKMPHLRADVDKLRDILENLVMNAIKFTPDGGVIKVRVGQQLGGYTTFSVQDQGPGIAPSDVPHIFDPFYSGGDVMQHSSGSVGFQKRGMGLGLAIVRHFADLHGGAVRVTTAKRGTTFTVLIPTDGPRDEIAPPEAPPDAEARDNHAEDEQQSVTSSRQAVPGH